MGWLRGWAGVGRVGRARVVCALAFAVWVIALSAVPAQAGDPLLDLIPARCHAVKLGHGPVTTKVVLTVRVTRVCEPGEHVSPIRVELEDDLAVRGQPLGSWHKTGRFCVIKHVPGHCAFRIKGPTSGGELAYRVGLSYTASRGSERNQTYNEVDPHYVTIEFAKKPRLPTEVTITAGGAIRSDNLKTGAQTCTGHGYPEGTSCFVNVPVNTTLTLMSTLDRPLPADWSWELDWPSDGTTLRTCGAGSTVCTAQATETQTGGIFVVKVRTANGGAGAALVTQPCTAGQTTNGQPCPS